MLVRYRYRLCPSPGQRQSLARVFGCARVVYNDCLRLREECHAAGEKISDSGVQRRVITLAKLTPERAWLAEVSSVALVQASIDAHRAYRNWFDSLSGARRGRGVGHPVFRRKHSRQSIRLTRNGFTPPARAAAVCGPEGVAMTAAILDELIARRTVPGRPPGLADNLAWIRAASGRAPHPDPRLPLVG